MANKKKRKRGSAPEPKAKIGLNIITWIENLPDLKPLIKSMSRPGKFKLNAHIIIPMILKEQAQNYPTDESVQMVFSDDRASVLNKIINSLKSKYVVLADGRSYGQSDEMHTYLPQLYSSLKKGHDLVTIQSSENESNKLPIWAMTTSDSADVSWPYDSKANYASTLNSRLIRRSNNHHILKMDGIPENTESFSRSKKDAFSEKIDFYFKEPIKILKDKTYSAYREHPIYRFIFAGLVILSFLGMSIMSQSAAISGDEFRYIEQAEKVYNYFATGGTDKSAITKTSIDPQHYNGQSFDNILFVIQKWLQFDDPFKFRHLLNSWTGWLTLFVASWIAIGLSGYRAGILTLLFCFFSPRFLGHSFNNHRDIPVALAAVLTIYFASRLLRVWPYISKKSLIGLILSLALAYSLRFGAGVLMTGILCVSAFTYWVVIHSNFRIFNGKNIMNGVKLASLTIAASILAYFVGIINWPFGLEGPISNGKEVLNATSNLGVTIRQLFEGKTIFSNQIPWYYTLKYIGITVPIVVLIGGLLSLTGFKYFNKKKKIDLFIILFCLVFPLVYTSIMTKNDYGGWRHFLFTLPFLAIAAAVGWTLVMDKFKRGSYQNWGMIALVLLLAHPILFTIRSHPYEYVYYNEIIGGIHGAYGNYETDYSQNSTKGAADWLIEHADEIVPAGQKLRIGTNNFKALKHYLRHHTDKFTTVYTRYYQKSEADWDYAAYSATYIDGDQIKAGYWPPEKPVATIEANGIPIGAVVKRVSKEDYLAIQAMKKNDVQQALIHLNNYIRINPNNEEVWVAKSRVELAQNNFAAADASVDRALELYPKFISAFDSKGRIMFASGKYPAAIEYFNKALDIRESYHLAHYFNAMSYFQLKNYDQAIESSQKCIGYQQKFTACYDTAAEAYRAKGDENTAQQYLNAKNNLK